MWMSGRKLVAACAALIVVAATISPDAASARAEGGPLMRVVVLPDTLAQASHELVPLDVTPWTGAGEPGSTIKLINLVYCAADASNGASILAAAQPSDQPTASVMLSSSDCTAAPSGLAAHLRASAPSVRWIKIIKGRASWQPWRMTVTITDVATAGSGAGLSFLKVGDSWSYSTADLALLPPADRNLNQGAANLREARNFRFDLAVAFYRNYILLALFSHGNTADPGPALKADEALRREIGSAPEGTSAVADAQDTFVNELLRVYAPVYEIPINVQGAAQNLTARDVSIAAGDNRLKVDGQVAFGQLSYDAVVDCAGEDLEVRDITLEAPPASCHGSDMMEQFRCQAQSAAMQASSNTLSSALTSYYQGQKFHYSTNGQPIRFNLGDEEFSATFEALKTSSAGSIVSEAGRATIRRITPGAH
jgi:hypothetical protein